MVQLALATWRLRRLYHQEAGFYTCQLQSLKGMQKDLNLDDAGRMGHAAAWSESTLGLFNRQEGRLERTFYRALHELQRLRKEREANLALVSQSTTIIVNKEVSADPPHNPSRQRGGRAASYTLYPTSARLTGRRYAMTPRPNPRPKIPITPAVCSVPGFLGVLGALGEKNGVL